MDRKQANIQIVLKNGDKVKVNDHVYCSPSWSIRDGTPYSVARIMEFLPPDEVEEAPPLRLKKVLYAKEMVKTKEQMVEKARVERERRKAKEPYSRVRLAWYYRPSDVSDRAVADSRLLLAAIYSEICDINQLRAKCYVIHRDKVTSLTEWKKKPDHFYFYRLFDPYIKKEFEVLLSTEIRNLPERIRQVLIARYEYVVAEKEVVTDLTDLLRLCETCEQWCGHIDAVQCARCKKHFHMSCVSPPLVAKPSRGYGWTCAPCSRRHEDQVDSGEASGSQVQPLGNRDGASRSNGVAVKSGRGRGRPRKEKPGPTPLFREEDLNVKHYKMWPFRYFGLYTVAEDTLDPDDLIFPRAATRVGPKYQATVPSSPNDSSHTSPVISSLTNSNVSVNSISQPVTRSSADLEERGGDATVEVMCDAVYWSSDELDRGDEICCTLAGKGKDMGGVKEVRLSYKVDYMVEFFRRASAARAKGQTLEAVNMQSVMHLEKWKTNETRWIDRAWSKEEVFAFEKGIAQFGAELRTIRDIIGTRSIPEVVRYYGHWKNARLFHENLGGKDRYAFMIVPSKHSKACASDDDESSLVNVPPSTAQGYSRSSTYCAACRTRESRIWWKAPKGLATGILCDNCGVNWRKYADLNARPSTRDDSTLNSTVNGGSSSAPVSSKTRSGEKREGSPMSGSVAKKAKTTASVSVASLTPPPPPPPQPPVIIQHRCLSCYRQGPNGSVVKCIRCGVTLHAGACGAVLEADQVDSWLCELCANEGTQEVSLNTDCLLCPRVPREARTGDIYPPPGTYLRACKPTEGQGWVHALCSVFIPDIQYSDAATLRVVEGLSTLPKHRWTTKCTLCGLEGGAVVRCGNCPKEYHVSCAWKIGHKFGFEIQPVKSSRRDITSMVTFKRETGAMNAIICCKEHSSYRRNTYDICDTNDVGETALQVYVRTYKQAPIAQSHSLLRKARRLDQLLSVGHGDTSSSSLSEQPPISPKCILCSTEYSPFFHPVLTSPDSWLCHRCHFEKRKSPDSVQATA